MFVIRRKSVISHLSNIMGVVSIIKDSVFNRVVCCEDEEVRVERENKGISDTKSVCLKKC